MFQTSEDYPRVEGLCVALGASVVHRLLIGLGFRVLGFRVCVCVCVQTHPQPDRWLGLGF